MTAVISFFVFALLLFFFPLKPTKCFFPNDSQHAPFHLSNVSFRRTCNLDCAVAADTLLSSLPLQHFYKIFFLSFFYLPHIHPKCKSELRAKASPLGHVEVSCSVSRAADFLLQSWRPQTRWRRTARGPAESRQRQEDRPAGCILPCASHLSWTC